PLHRDAEVDELIDPIGEMQMALAFGDIIYVRIFFLLVHDIRVFDELDQDIKFIPKIQRQHVPAPGANNLDLARYFELQQHETVFLIKRQPYRGIAMTKILLLIRLKEPIRNPVVKLMNTSLK